ncbi:MAG TPA: hypothetical protein VGU27_01375 [Candidatus Eisenbacteria bacterium]|nr:hypothetical protein [Candidatus Eisenbacteria bacterium]
MSSQKLVRCELRRNGGGASQVRYVPLEIFGLWEHLMTSRHEFEVLAPCASLWLDMEDSPDAAYSQDQYERVTEVTAYVYSDRDEMFTRARRYFPSGDAEALKRIFLSHYSHEEGRIQTQIHERDGIWIARARAEAAV